MLQPAVIQAMRELIQLQNAIAEQPVARPGRLHRKTNQNREAKKQTGQTGQLVPSGDRINRSLFLRWNLSI